jgi:hypothetical protein
MIEENDSLEDMDIRHVKLSDGSDIIAYINSVEGSSIVVERPMNLNLVTTANGFDTYFFTKYFPFAKDNLVNLNLRNIISASEVTSEIKEKYLQSAIRTDNDTDIDNTMNDLDEEGLNLNFMKSPSKKYH